MEGLTTARLAHEGGVNVETIRYYERHGLLPTPPRTHSGYRIFSEDAVKRLRFIKHAQDLGFSLKEIKELLALRVKLGSSCADVRRKAETKIVDVDEKIQRYRRLKRRWFNSRIPVAGGVRLVPVQFSKPWMMRGSHEPSWETDFACDARDRGCDAAKIILPAMLAALCGGRVQHRARFRSWNKVLATDHERLPGPDACGSCHSRKATPGIWSSLVRYRRFNRNSDREVLLGIESAYVRRCGFSGGCILVECLAAPREFNRVSMLCSRRAV